MKPPLYQKLSIFILIIICFSSCVPHQELINFNEGPDFATLQKATIKPPTLHIQPDDVLNISVRTFDMKTAAPYNLNITIFDNNINNAGNIGAITDYLVDKEGYIDFPELGRLKVGGLTMIELKELLLSRLSSVLKNPTIIVRFSNFKFTVLGAVSRPSTYTVQEEQVTILEAIGMAGDLNVFASRENVLIIREQNGEREFGRINLRDRNAFQSPYFFLRQNDVIYVEPRSEQTIRQRDQLSVILPWLSVITSVTTLILTLTRL